MAGTNYEGATDYGSLLDSVEAAGRHALGTGISATIRHARELRNHGGQLLNALLDHGSALVNRESVPDEVHAQRLDAWHGLRSNAGRLALAGALLGGGYLTLRAIDYWRNHNNSAASQASAAESTDVPDNTHVQPSEQSDENYATPASAVVSASAQPTTFHLRFRTDHNAPSAEMKLEDLGPLARV